jgi:hypothetical protein
MTDRQKYTPMLNAGGLWAKTSAKGWWYLTEWLGGVKVLILANRDWQPDNDPSHILYFVEGADRHQGAQERGDGRRAPPAPQKLPRPQRGGFHQQGKWVPNHQALLNDDVLEWAL